MTTTDPTPNSAGAPASPPCGAGTPAGTAAQLEADITHAASDGPIGARRLAAALVAAGWHR